MCARSRERLEVGLDAGTAAGVGGRDREGARDVKTLPSPVRTGSGSAGVISAALERHPGVVRLAMHHYGRCGFFPARPRRPLVCGCLPRRPLHRHASLHGRGGAARALGARRPARAVRLPPALAARATPRILELLGEPPARVLELGFAGIHAVPLRLAGFDVVVVEPDPRIAAAPSSGRAPCSPSRRPSRSTPSSPRTALDAPGRRRK